MSSILENVSVVALISAAMGGVGTEFIGRIFGRKKADSDVALAERKQDFEHDTAIRAELRGEAERHRVLAKSVETERDVWRGKFFDSAENLVAAQGQILQMRERLVELEELREQTKHLQDQNDTLVARLRATQK